MSSTCWPEICASVSFKTNPFVSTIFKTLELKLHYISMSILHTEKHKYTKLKIKAQKQAWQAQN
jgi:hypothetical protein